MASQNVIDFLTANNDHLGTKDKLTQLRGSNAESSALLDLYLRKAKVTFKRATMIKPELAIYLGKREEDITLEDMEEIEKIGRKLTYFDIHN